MLRSRNTYYEALKNRAAGEQQNGAELPASRGRREKTGMRSTTAHKVREVPARARHMVTGKGSPLASSATGRSVSVEDPRAVSGEEGLFPDLLRIEARLPPWTMLLMECLSESQHRAYLLREAGHSYSEIGRWLGVSPERALHLVDQAAARMTTVARKAVLLVVEAGPGKGPFDRAPQRFPVPVRLRPALDLPVASLGLRSRTVTCLANHGIRYVGGLVRHSEEDLSRIRNLGRRILAEIRESLAKLELEPGMETAPWEPPEAQP